MKIGLQLFLVLKAWVVVLPLFFTLSYSELANNDTNPGFISIDCGVTESYTDETTGIWYQPDTDFIETGTNHALTIGNNNVNPYFGRQLNTLRSFPQGARSCYTLKPKQGKNNMYLIRANFAYGNYDNKGQFPVFELYLGVYYWDTIQGGTGHPYYYTEVNHTPSTDTIYVCLVNTGQGTPFISSLELRILNNSIYQTMSSSLPQYLLGRFGLGRSSQLTHLRYKDDVYDRLWNTNNNGWNTFSTPADIYTDEKDDAYKLPAQVLTSAVKPVNGSDVLFWDWDYDASYEYYVYLHFLEIEKLAPGQKRIINVTFNDENFLSKPITFEYLKPFTISPKNTSTGYARVLISATAESDVPPILNAIEIYRVTPQSYSPADAGDVAAILEIKRKYNISRIDWQGDPCVPLPVAWSGLNCSSGNSLRIISLNLSSSTLAGEIATSLSNLSKLESLDLSNNKLSGALPEFLGELPNLKILNLSGNKFTGSVPKALKEKSDNKTLQLSLAESAGLGQKASSKKQKFVVPLVLSIAVLVLFLTVCLAVWKLKRKRQAGSKKEGSLKLKGQIFSYSKVLSITDNFKTIIGEGGFGKVYLGTLKNGSQVAAKLLSLSSMQGFKEFQSEARLLMILHHRNLVSLVGYADDGDFKALIYEYMSNGNLHQQLSDKNPGVLRWSQRLQIALDTAYGVDYLHNGCKPPIIQRDLKTSNILLNENMQAKIADFGLCKAFANDSDTHVKTRPAGTPGYLDPQFQSCGKLNKKSDVYSFGIILFELITGQPAIIRTAENTIHILDWVIPLIERGDIQSVTDPRLQGKFNTSSAWKAVEIAMSCIPPKAIQRPDISHILSELKECLSLEMDPAEVTTSLIESQITEVSAR